MPNRYVWIVEGNYEVGGRMTGWHPTVGIGLTKADASQRLEEWKKRNPDEWFRIVRYSRRASR